MISSIFYLRLVFFNHLLTVLHIYIYIILLTILSFFYICNNKYSISFILIISYLGYKRKINRKYRSFAYFSNLKFP